MNKKGSGIRSVWVNIILLALISVSLIGFMFAFRADNHITDTLNTDNSSFISTYLNLSSSLTNLQYTSFGWYNASSNDNPDSTMIYLIFKSMAKLPFTIFDSAITIAKSLFAFFGIILPDEVVSLLIGVLASILFVTAIFLIYKVIRTGESDR